MGGGVGDGLSCVPEYLRRVVCYQQMDFDFMLWQMIYLFLSPSKVFVVFFFLWGGGVLFCFLFLFCFCFVCFVFVLFCFCFVCFVFVGVLLYPLLLILSPFSFSFPHSYRATSLHKRILSLFPFLFLSPSHSPQKTIYNQLQF